MTGVITQERVDGIQTVLAPRSGSRMAAGLLFRVGRADETLSTSGITHLVEHLALHEHGVGDLHFNGATADVYTHFHVEGTSGHVVEYLNGVCAALNDLPLHRLEVEKEILRTEASGRGFAAGNMALYRYGAQGYGLASYEEMGLPRLDPETVSAWTRTHFTTENAVLWITSDTVPAGLELRLPSGRRNPAPAPTSALPRTPAWYAGSADGVYLHAVVPRSTPARLYTTVLAKALFHDLRQKGGYSYTATADYWPRDRDSAVVFAMADALPEKREAVVGGFVDVLARLRLGTITEAELASAKAAARRDLDVDSPDLGARMLPSHAMNLLLGHHNLTLEELLEEIDATTVVDLRAVAEQVHSSALVQVPALGLDWAGLDRAPETSERRVHGREFARLDNDGWPRLAVADNGVSLLWSDAQVTVLYRDVAVMQSWADGGRRLIDRDGMSVAIEPTLYDGLDESAMRTVDEAVPSAVVVPLPARPADRVPRPEPQPQAARGRRRGAQRVAPSAPSGPVRGTLRTVGWWLCVGAAVIMGLAALDTSYELVQSGANPDEDLTPGLVITMWILVLLPAWGAWKLRRR